MIPVIRRPGKTLAPKTLPLVLLILGFAALAGWVDSTAARTSARTPTQVDTHDARGRNASQSFTFRQLNREWTNEVTEAAPVTQGGVTIHLTSPENRVRLHRHELRLTPLPDGSHGLHLSATFDGEGEVRARLEVGGGGSELEDQVTVPLQDTEIEGRVQIRATPDGYLFTTVELPPRAAVEIESRLAGRFTKLCNALAGPFLPMNCQALEAGLSRVVFPLPTPGETYLLPRDLLTTDEQATFEDYLRAGDAPDGAGGGR